MWISWLADDSHEMLSLKSYFLWKNMINWTVVYYNLAWRFNSFLVSGDFCRLLIIFVNSLDQDQARQNVGPDLDQTDWHW